jgi:hypothetical protein
MASTDSRPVPQKNTAYRVIFPILDADGDPVSGASGLDSEISKDCGTFADCTNEATEIATSSGIYYLDLTSTEMNADSVAIIVKTSTSGAKTTPIILYPEEAGDIRVNVTAFGGTAGTFASGRPEVNTTHLAGTSQTARDIGASVLLSSGTGTGQVTLTSGRVNADITHINTAAVSTSTAQLGVNVVNFGGSAGTFASGRPEVNASHIGGSAISQSSGVANVNVAQISGDSTAADNAESFFDGTGYAGTNNVIPTVTTTTNLTNKGDGSGFTAIPWNASWDAEVQSECADALTAYDPPTNAELVSEINSVQADIAALNNLSAAQVNAEVDTALADINLDHLVKNAVDTDWATTVHLNSVIGHIADNGTSATFDRTTDSLEALQAEHDVTQGKVDAVDDFVDTEVAAIKTVVDAIKLSTDNLPSDPADASVIAGLISGLDTKLDTIDNFVDTEVAAIKTVTDKVDTALVLDGAVYQFTANALELAPTGGSAPTAADIADAVWEEGLTDHSGTAGSVAEALAAAGSAGDPWATALPGAYSSGSAGKIIGDNLNATISSRASQTSVDTIDGIVDAILVDTAEIGAAGAGLTALATQTSVNDIPTNAELATALDALPTAAENATATWAAGTRTLSAFGFTVDTNANATETAILADTNELQTDWANGGRLDLILDARASQTSVDDLPTNAELATALGTADDDVLAAIAALNNLSQANIRTAIGLASANLDTQLADLPTNSELTAALASADDATLAAVAALNNLSSAQVQTAATAALNAYDPPTRTEATSDANSILTAIDALPTNAELATALGTADDAVLAAISPVATKVDELHKIQGLDIANPMTVTTTSRTAGTIDLEISGNGTTTSTVTRQ